MHYDLTKVSEEEAQIVGDVLAKAVIRITRQIGMAEDNLEYQKSYGSGLNGLYVLPAGDWEDAAKETESRLARLRSRLSQIEAILAVITVN